MIKAGSLTIEASLVLPIFLFFMICFLSLSSLMLFMVRLKEAMHEEAKIIAMERADGKEYSLNSVKEDILAAVGTSILKIAPVEGREDGIDFSRTSVEDDQFITITAEYKSKLYYDFGGLFDRKFIQSSTFHTWCGYEDGLYARDNLKEDEEYVYVTEGSEVYHMDRECTHIRLKITEVDASDIKELRNSDGGKYHSCEHCHSKTADGTLYITADGDCYHNSLSCSGLKRTVTAIPLSEAKEMGLRSCSRCGR